MLNRCEFIGNLGADPDVRQVSNGDKVVNLRLAVTQKWKDRDSGERKEHTDWIPVVIWDQNLCAIAEQYLKKGSKVFIAGAFQTRSWEKDGAKRYTSEIVLQRYRGDLVMLGDVSREAREPEPMQSPDLDDNISDTIPF